METSRAVDAFLAAKRAGGRSPRTLEWYRGALRRFADTCPQLPAAAEDIEAFLGSLTVGDESRYSYWRLCKAFFRWLERRYQLPNPMALVDPPLRRRKYPATLTAVQQGYLFAAPLERRDRALIALLIDTGVRIGEALQLQVEDIGEDTIRVCGKTGSREVPISGETRRLLLELASSGYVWSSRGGCLSREQAYRLVQKAMLAAGIHARKMGPHTLRHTFGRQWIMNGGDLVSLQRILGHTNIATTRIYVELSVADIIEQHHKYTPVRAAMAPQQLRLLAPDSLGPDRPNTSAEGR